MGFFMARNLAKNRPQSVTPLPPTLVWNRTKSRAEDLVKEVGDDKAQIAKDPEEVARECDIIFTNLANDDVVKEIYLRFAQALEVGTTIVYIQESLCHMRDPQDSPSLKPKIFVETSTVYPTLAGESHPGASPSLSIG